MYSKSVLMNKNYKGKMWAYYYLPRLRSKQIKRGSIFIWLPNKKYAYVLLVKTWKNNNPIVMLFLKMTEQKAIKINWT